MKKRFQYLDIASLRYGEYYYNNSSNKNLNNGSEQHGGIQCGGREGSWNPPVVDTKADPQRGACGGKNSQPVAHIQGRTDGVRQDVQLEQGPPSD